MNGPPRFLVVDDNPDSRFLLVKTLLRKFPTGLVQECQSGEAAAVAARTDKMAAIISHRGYEEDGISLVRKLREANSQVPIIMVSGIDRTSEALAAGADAFLHDDQWLRIGTLVGDVVAGKKSSHNARIRASASNA